MLRDGSGILSKVQSDNYARVDDHHIEQFNANAKAIQILAAAEVERAASQNAKLSAMAPVPPSGPQGPRTGEKCKPTKAKNPTKTNVLRGSSSQFASLRSVQVPEAGVETSAFEPENTAYSENGGHPGGQFGQDSDLQAVIKAWPNLSDDDRQSIVDVIRRRTIR